MMEKPDKQTEKRVSLLPKVKLMDWKPDESLSAKISESWGLEGKNERTSADRPK